VSEWPAWSIDQEPVALARYVRPDLVGQYVHLPGPSNESLQVRAKDVYERIAAHGIGYAHERPFATSLAHDGDGGHAPLQEIRSPHEVFWAPQHATCLDLAVVLAAAYMVAGLCPMIVIVSPPDPSVPRHALVAVRIAGAGANGRSRVARVVGEPPEGLADAVQERLDGPPRDMLVIDPNGLARSLGTAPVVGTSATFAQAIAAGAGYLTGGAWQWAVGIEVGTDTVPYQPPDHPEVEPLREPYRDPRTAESALRRLRAEYQLVPFQARDEVTVLLDFCRGIAAGRRDGKPTGLAIVHAVGGAGKTRLALELAERLRREGWYAGPLRESAEPGWLTHVQSPALVVVDYADARVAETQGLLRVLKQRTGPPAVVLMTARAATAETPLGDAEADWLREVLDSLTADAHPYLRDIIALPEQHPRGRDVFAATRDRLNPAGANGDGALPRPIPGVRWTTLDLVLLGCLAAEGTRELPSTPETLYGEVLGHERKYWAEAYIDLANEGSAPSDLLLLAAACLTLLSPLPSSTDRALTAVEALAGDGAAHWRDQVRRTFLRCLSPAPGERLAVRPDPVGDHLMVAVLEADLARRLDPATSLLQRALATAEGDELKAALLNLNRAGQATPENAAALIATAVTVEPGRWRPLLEVAAIHRGPAELALTDLAQRPDTPLRLSEVSNALPFSPLGPHDLARIIDERRLDEARESCADTVQMAELHSRVGRRRTDSGQRESALDSMSEAVDLYRQLAEAGPATHLPDLARSLNGLSNCQSAIGDEGPALASITETVAIHRRLADADPATYLPDLAESLNGLSNCQSATGDHEAALATITEAVQIRTQLTEANPAAHLPNLATSLNNLSVLQAAAGDRRAALASSIKAVDLSRGVASASPDLAAYLHTLSNAQSATGGLQAALASISEAVSIRMQLAEANPAAYLPDLAMSMHNLANRQAATGDHANALDTVRLVVDMYRRIAAVYPAAYLPMLASSLNNLANRELAAGNRQAALTAASEAVTLYQPLAAANPNVYRPQLAGFLITLASAQSATGDQPAALNSLTESVGLSRALAAANPDAHLPGLALSLGHLAVQQTASGNRSAALDSITETVAIWRRLAAAEPAAHLPRLADSLNTLSNRQAEAGDSQAALASSTEAVGLYRQLATDNFGAHLPHLADSLNTLSNRQAEAGDSQAALASSAEAVDLQQQLAANVPAASMSDRAASLHNLSVQLAAVGDDRAALASSAKSVDLYRSLAAVDPAYLPELAGSLINLGNRQSAVGDYQAALDSVSETVDLYRQLAADDPAAYRYLFAGSLNNLSNRLSETGHHQDALGPIVEAVDLFRRLAADDPAEHLPRLAGSLNNLSVRLAASGDDEAALAAIGEAVGIRRRLADANPATHLPDLAASLHYLGLRLSRVGRSEAALAAAQEAVYLRQALADANPAAHLPNLAASLGQLCDRLADLAHEPAYHEAWQGAVGALNDPLAAAELTARFASWLIGHGETAEAATELSAAAIAADGPLPFDADRQTVIRLTRTRQTIRSVAERLSAAGAANLPIWATAPLPEEDIRFLATWVAAGDWPSLEELLRAGTSRLTSPTLPATVAVLAALDPIDPRLANIAAQLRQFSDLGLEPVLAANRADHERRTLIMAWINTGIGDESQRFLNEHLYALRTDEVAFLLAESDEPVAQQHLAILNLSATHPIDDLYEIITSESATEDAALQAIETGNVEDLRAIFMAAPRLAEIPVTGALSTAVLALTQGAIDSAKEYAAQAASQASDVQRRANILRLRSLTSQPPRFSIEPLTGT
jgi:Tetratricopeptide repeat